MEQQIQLNDHNKQEYPPMHTAEHLLNATMVKTFGCPRSRNAHIERKKSKCDYILSSCPTAEQIQSIEDRVNEVISQNLPVTVEFMTHEQAKDIVDLRNQGGMPVTHRHYDFLGIIVNQIKGEYSKFRYSPSFIHLICTI